jgi:hypothetical protein
MSLKPRRRLGSSLDVLVEPKSYGRDAGDIKSCACEGRSCVGSRKTGNSCSGGVELLRVSNMEWHLIFVRKQEGVEVEVQSESSVALRWALDILLYLHDQLCGRITAGFLAGQSNFAESSHTSVGTVCKWGCMVFITPRLRRITHQLPN